MTSAKELLHSIKFRHEVNGHGKPIYKILSKTKDKQIYDQFPLGYILPSLSSLTYRGTNICFEEFSFKVFCKSAIALESHSE